MGNHQTYTSNSGREAAAGEMPHFLIWWVLAILWRSEHMCLFSESRKVFWVNLVNMALFCKNGNWLYGASWLNLCSNLFF